MPDVVLHVLVVLLSQFFRVIRRCGTTRMYSNGAWLSSASPLDPEIIHQLFTSLAGVEPARMEKQGALGGRQRASSSSFPWDHDARPTGRLAVRPRRLGDPGPSRCRRGSGVAPRRPPSFLQVPREAVTGLRRWDSLQVRLHIQCSRHLFSSAQRLCVDSTRRCPHRGVRHGVSRANGEDAPGGGRPTCVSVVGAPIKRLGNGVRPGPSADGPEEPRARAQSWLEAVV